MNDMREDHIRFCRVRSPWWLPVAVVMLAPACQEQLPSYEDPRDLFVSYLAPRITYRSDGVSIDVNVVLINAFDETLDDVIDVDGWVSVTMGGDPSTVRTLTLSTTELSARSFVPASRRLTLDPGDSVVFRVRYDFFDDTGRDLRDAVMRWMPDPSCEVRLLSTNMSYEFRASVGMYKRTAATIPPPAIAWWCVPRQWVSDKICPFQTRPGICP